MELSPSLPPAHHVDLPGRGRTWVYDSGASRNGAAATARAEAGNGRPVVLLLHGWTTSAALNWYRCFGPLAARHRVVAPDHRGHGRGIRSRRPFRLEDCADDAAALVQELDLGPVIAVGYSMGGPVALWTWRRHPELVRGLVLCATAAAFGTMPRWSGRKGDLIHAGAVALGYTPGGLRGRVMARLARRWAGDGAAAWAVEEWARHDPAALLQCGMALSRYDVTGWIGEVDVPTAVLVTEQDTTVSPGRQRALAEGIPGAASFPVAGAHRACVDQADRFVPALLSALSTLETEPSLQKTPRGPGTVSLGPAGSAGGTDSRL